MIRPSVMKRKLFLSLSLVVMVHCCERSADAFHRSNWDASISTRIRQRTVSSPAASSWSSTVMMKTVCFKNAQSKSSDNDEEEYEEELDRMARLMEQQSGKIYGKGTRTSKPKPSIPNDGNQSYSLEVLAILFSLLFVVIVGVFGEKFVVAPPVHSTNNNDLVDTRGRRQRPKAIDADALLQDEFRRVPSSVEFH